MTSSKFVLLALTLLVASVIAAPTQLNNVRCVNCTLGGNYYCVLEGKCFNGPQSSSSSCLMNTTDAFYCGLSLLNTYTETPDASYANKNVTYKVGNDSYTMVAVVSASANTVVSVASADPNVYLYQSSSVLTTATGLKNSTNTTKPVTLGLLGSVEVYAFNADYTKNSTFTLSYKTNGSAVLGLGVTALFGAILALFAF